MLLNIEKVSHSHLVQCCDSRRSLYNKGLEQEEKMALLHLGKNTKTTMPLLGGRLDKFINQSFLFPKHFHLSPCTQERSVLFSTDNDSTASLPVMWACSFYVFFFFLFQDFKEAHNKCGEMLQQALNVIIQGSKKLKYTGMVCHTSGEGERVASESKHRQYEHSMWFKREKY